MRFLALFVSRSLGGARPRHGLVASLLLLFAVAAHATTAADSFSGALLTSRGNVALAAAATGDIGGGGFNERTSGAIFSGLRPLPAFVPIGNAGGSDGLFTLPGSESAVPSGIGSASGLFSDTSPPNTTHVVFFGGGGPRLIGGYVTPGSTGNGSLTFSGVVVNAGELIEVSRLLPGNRTPSDRDMGPAERAARAEAVAAERAGFGSSFQFSSDLPSEPALIAVALLSVLGVAAFLFFRWRQRALMRVW